jgi:lipoprotein-releasing system permease protein
MGGALAAYLFRYVLHAKTRQRLLFLALFGLCLSSFALLVLQSTMGGFQMKLIERSKKVMGHGVVESAAYGADEVTLPSGAVKELELELLIRHRNFIFPVIAHGLDFDRDQLPAWPASLAGPEIIIPRDLALRLELAIGDKVQLISPSHVDSFFDDIPRSITLKTARAFSSDVPEIDLGHIWVRAQALQNLIREESYNRVRFYGESAWKKRDQVLASLKEARALAWEDKNETLVWALGLESSVMLFLFGAMTLLVSLSITTSLMIFFDKLKGDLAAFWILGAPKADIERGMATFLVIAGTAAILLGLGLGFILLGIIDRHGTEILSNVFVDRKIPVYLTAKGISIAFAIPALIAFFFSWLGLKQFKERYDALTIVRTVGAG